MRLEVKNLGKRVRHRAGYKFEPGKTVTVNVPNAAARAIYATRDLQVFAPEAEEVEIDQPIDTTPAEHDGQESEKIAAVTSDAAIDISDLTVDQALQAVDAGRIDAAEALSQEKQGQGRKSLIEALESLEK